MKSSVRTEPAPGTTGTGKVPVTLWDLVSFRSEVCPHLLLQSSTPAAK
jgi:hypothetical protein